MLLTAACAVLLASSLTVGSSVILRFSQQSTEKLLKKVADTAQCLRNHVFSTRFVGVRKRPTLSLSEIVARGDCYLAAAEDFAAWEFVGEEKKVRVFKLKSGYMKFPERDDGRWPCVKSSTVLFCEPTEVLHLLLDSSQTRRYNQYSVGRVDVDIVSPKTKYVWNKTQVPFARKPYDFCNVMHCFERTTASGKELVLLSRYVEHPLVPRNNQYMRSENIIGLQILKQLSPSGKRPRTLLTSVSHVRYGGTHPFLISKNLLRGTANYLATFRDFCHCQGTSKVQPYDS